MAPSGFVLAPSVLSADLARLGEEVDAVCDAGADMIHFDVMDNHYVPNLTFGPMLCEALRRYGVATPIDVHLMVTPVDALIESFAKAGASSISFHVEASEHIDRSLQLIRSHGCQAGLAFNPATPLTHLRYLMDAVDFVLIMSVNPGFGGQAFIRSALTKLRDARSMIDNSQRPIRLAVDGGVSCSSIREIAEAGADTFVAGSAIFGSDDYKATLLTMREELGRAKLRGPGLQTHVTEVLARPA